MVLETPSDCLARIRIHCSEKLAGRSLWPTWRCTIALPRPTWVALVGRRSHARKLSTRLEEHLQMTAVLEGKAGMGDLFPKYRDACLSSSLSSGAVLPWWWWSVAEGRAHLDALWHVVTTRVRPLSRCPQVIRSGLTNRLGWDWSLW